MYSTAKADCAVRRTTPPIFLHDSTGRSLGIFELQLLCHGVLYRLPF